MKRNIKKGIFYTLVASGIGAVIGISSKTLFHHTSFYTGESIYGETLFPSVFERSGIMYASKHDVYLNTKTKNIYLCTKSGIPSIAKWKYIGPVGATKIIKGEPGPQGPQGDKGDKGDPAPSVTVPVWHFGHLNNPTDMQTLIATGTVKADDLYFDKDTKSVYRIVKQAIPTNVPGGNSAYALSFEFITNMVKPDVRDDEDENDAVPSSEE